jgi:predicted DNA-binding transcriptional regulator YafY
MSPARENPVWVARRRWVLLRRLLRGPASREELIQCVLDELDAEAYGGARGRALEKRFEGDKRRLAEVYGLRLRYRRSSAAYEIEACDEALLDLCDDDLFTLAFLHETFGPDAPQSERVQRLLQRLRGLLPDERRAAVESQRLALRVQWGQRDQDVIPADVETALARAITQRRLVCFDYLSPGHADGLARRHTVEPWERYFDSTRGHHYLRGYCRRISGPPGGAPAGRYLRYRLGRIRHVELLPEKLPPQPPPTPRYDVVYRLSASIARRGDVSRQSGIEMLCSEPQPDGSIIVRGRSDDVWWAMQALLHYGASCEVLGGAEAREQMRQFVREMAQVYGFARDDE